MHALGAQQRAQPGSSLGCVLLGCAYVQIRDFTPWGSSEGGLAPALEGDGGVCLHPPARPRWWPAQGRVQGPGDPQRAQNHTGRAGSVVAWLRTKMTSERTPRCVRTSGSPEREGLGGGVVGGWGTGEGHATEVTGGVFSCWLGNFCSIPGIQASDLIQNTLCPPWRDAVLPAAWFLPLCPPAFYPAGGSPKVSLGSAPSRVPGAMGPGRSAATSFKCDYGVPWNCYFKNYDFRRKDTMTPTLTLSPRELRMGDHV